MVHSIPGTLGSSFNSRGGFNSHLLKVVSAGMFAIMYAILHVVTHGYAGVVCGLVGGMLISLA